MSGFKQEQSVEFNRKKRNNRKELYQKCSLEGTAIHSTSQRKEMVLNCSMIPGNMCVYVPMFVWHICNCMCVYFCMCVYVGGCISVIVCVCVCRCVDKFEYVWVYVCVCVIAYMCTYVYICVCIYVCMCESICVCVWGGGCVYVCILTHECLCPGFLFKF